MSEAGVREIKIIETHESWRDNRRVCANLLNKRYSVVRSAKRSSFSSEYKGEAEDSYNEKFIRRTALF